MLVGDRYAFHTTVNAFTAGRKKTGIFVYYGGGKTYLSLKWLETIREDDSAAIVLCPSGLIPQWVAEAETLGGIKAVAVVGTGAQRTKLLRANPSGLFVLGYDAIRNIDVRIALRDLAPKYVIADESTRVKNQRTHRFKRLHSIFQHSPYRAILTGRPMEENPEELFAQMLFLDNGVTFGRSFGYFRHDYFQPGPPWDPWKWRLRKDAPHRIAKKLREAGCIYVPKEEVLAQLPPAEKNYIELTLSPQAMRLYKEMKADFRMHLPSGKVVDTIWATTKALKLQQISAGVVYIDPERDAEGCKIGPRDIEVVDTTKIDWLVESIPEMLKESSVLVWSCFTSSVGLIHAALEAAHIPSEMYYGDLKDDEKTKVIDRWKSSKENTVLILSQLAGCEGKNLQRAKHAVFVSVHPAAAKLDNAMARNRRSGSEIHDRIVYWLLCGKGTVDDKIVKAIVNKRDVGDAIMQHLLEES